MSKDVEPETAWHRYQTVRKELELKRKDHFIRLLRHRIRQRRWPREGPTYWHTFTFTDLEASSCRLEIVFRGHRFAVFCCTHNDKELRDFGAFCVLERLRLIADFRNVQR